MNFSRFHHLQELLTEYFFGQLFDQLLANLEFVEIIHRRKLFEIRLGDPKVFVRMQHLHQAIGVNIESLDGMSY